MTNYSIIHDSCTFHVTIKIKNSKIKHLGLSSNKKRWNSQVGDLEADVGFGLTAVAGVLSGRQVVRCQHGHHQLPLFLHVPDVDLNSTAHRLFPSDLLLKQQQIKLFSETPKISTADIFRKSHNKFFGAENG